MKKIDMHMHLRQGPMQNHLGTDFTFMAPDDIRLSFWLDEAVQRDQISQRAYAKVCRENALKIINS